MKKKAINKKQQRLEEIKHIEVVHSEQKQLKQYSLILKLSGFVCDDSFEKENTTKQKKRVTHVTAPDLELLFRLIYLNLKTSLLKL